MTKTQFLKKVYTYLNGKQAIKDFDNDKQACYDFMVENATIKEGCSFKAIFEDICCTERAESISADLKAYIAFKEGIDEKEVNDFVKAQGFTKTTKGSIVFDKVK